MRNSVLDEAQTGIKIARIINNLRYADDTTLMAESEEELKSLLVKMKEASEKVGLKLNIHLKHPTLSIETCILSIVKHITSPGWMHETSAWAWCTGKSQRVWVEREVGGGIGMGNTCKSMAYSCQCMTKPTIQYCKVISFQIIQINEK